MSTDINPFYKDKPRRTYKLDNAYRMESKTRQFPFVIAHEVAQTQIPAQPSLMSDDLLLSIMNNADVKLEVSDDDDGPKREFIVFHDFEHFLYQRQLYPHAHEIIRCPSTTSYIEGVQRKEYRDDMSKGRLIFDFDLTSPLPEMEGIMTLKNLNRSTEIPLTTESPVFRDFKIDRVKEFVPPNFKTSIEFLIMEVLKNYYRNIDLTKIAFIWQRSPSLEKFSMHLIVKNIYFSEYWVKQMRIFYSLLEKVAYNNNFQGLLKAVDFQIPRRNGTFRMIGSSKIGGNPLELESVNYNGVDLLKQGVSVGIYDCLVGLHCHEHMISEQSLSLDNLDHSKLQVEVNQEEPSNNETGKRIAKINKDIVKNLSLFENKEENVDLTDGDVKKALDLFDEFNDGSFHVRDQVGSIINLDRSRKSECPLSGTIHERENAYLSMKSNGHLVFYCRRGCRKGNSYGLDLGVFRYRKREQGVIPVNCNRLAKVNDIKILVRDDIPSYLNNSIKYSKTKTGAKRVAISNHMVEIPPALRKQKDLIKFTL